MLDLEPVEFGGVKVVPRDFLLARIEPRLQREARRHRRLRDVQHRRRHEDSG